MLVSNNLQAEDVDVWFMFVCVFSLMDTLYIR